MDIRKERDVAVGVFTDLAHASEAVDELRRHGFADEAIGFIADEPAEAEAPVPPGSQAGKGAAVGATVGGVLGTALGLAASVIVLPLAGPAIVGGLLAGAAAGGASGGVLGALLGLSVPEEEAHRFDREFHSGRSLVTVRAGDRYAEAEAILKRVAERPETHHHRHRPGGSSSGGAGDGAGGVFATPP